MKNATIATKRLKEQVKSQVFPHVAKSLRDRAIEVNDWKEDRPGVTVQDRRRRNRANPQPSAKRSIQTDSYEEFIEQSDTPPHAFMVVGPEDQEARQKLGLIEEAPQNTGEYLPQSTPPLVFAQDPRLELRRHAIFQLYLRGYPRESIQTKVHIGFEALKKELKHIKRALAEYMEKNPQVFGSPLEVLYLQVLRRRERQSALWEELGGVKGQTKPQFYRLIAEEDTAIEKLLGITKENLSVIIGTPMEAVQADFFQQLGPAGLKTLLIDLQKTYSLVTKGQDIRTIEGSVELVGTSPLPPE